MIAARGAAVIGGTLGESGFRPLGFERLSPPGQRRRLSAHRRRMAGRRSVRDFSSEPVPIGLVQEAVRVACGAPSGANLQPWHFVIVSDAATKRAIRLAAEREERINYERRFPPEWKARLGPLGTDWHKEFLETAPHLIVVFAVIYERDYTRGTPGEIVKHYYVSESVGIATGFLITSLHLAGLVTLTHTPSPMGFLRTILRRPENEKPYLLLPVGYPAPDAAVPVIERKPLDEVMTIFTPESAGE